MFPFEDLDNHLMSGKKLMIFTPLYISTYVLRQILSARAKIRFRLVYGYRCNRGFGKDGFDFCFNHTNDGHLLILLLQTWCYSIKNYLIIACHVFFRVVIPSLDGNKLALHVSHYQKKLPRQSYKHVIVSGKILPCHADSFVY